MHAPSLEQFRAAADSLAGRAIRTPCMPLKQAVLSDLLPQGADVAVKLELFQQAGSFKARGNLLGIDALSPDQKAAGVAAASGGNHALAVAWAAKLSGVKAALFMPEATDPIRVEGCRALGAAVTLTSDIAAAFEAMQGASERDGMTAMHPFEAEHMILGAGTCGLEFVEDVADLDIFILPVGGGGLIAGMAAAIRHLQPQAEIYGVEPEGADSMRRSFAAGAPVKIDRVSTIADSLGAPYALERSFAVTRETVEAIVTVPDKDLRRSMGLYFDACRIVAEPACAAALAGLIGPLAERCRGKRVGIIACGSNISIDRYRALMR